MRPHPGLLVAAMLVAGCEREQRSFDAIMMESPARVFTGYIESAWNISEGKGPPWQRVAPSDAVKLVASGALTVWATVFLEVLMTRHP